MSIVTPVDVAIAISENDPKSTTKTYTFKNVKNCNGNIVAELPVTLNIAWTSYWTEDHRLCPPAPPPPLSICAKIKHFIFFLPALIVVMVYYVGTGLLTIIFGILALLFMPITHAMAACLFNRAAPVLSIGSFHYWLERNGFTSEEMKKVKEATKTMTIHKLAHTVTDVRAVEQIFKLQSIEKQKLVIVVLQQSLEAIDKAHQKEFEKLQAQYACAIFTWGAQEAYKLGDAIAKNGRLCSRGEDARKKGDWEQRVASRVNLRVNAVLRCINTIASEGKYSESDGRLTDLERTLNRNDVEVDWKVFVAKNKDHDNKLLGEFHFAAIYVKQYVTHAIVTESYPKRFGRICWAWTVLLILIVIKLAKVVLKLELHGIFDIADLIVGAVTHLAETPTEILDMVENGLPTGSGISLPGSGVPGAGNHDTTGSMMNMLNDKLNNSRLNARLENKTAQQQQSMKLDKLTELAHDQNPAVSPQKAG